MEITIASILIRVSVMYLYALAMIRISGKQSISELSTMDFVVSNILGDAFDTVIFGEVPLVQGLVYFATIVAVHFLVRLLASRSLLIHRLVTSPPTMMIQSGVYVKMGLQAERMRVDDVQAELRLRGEDQLEEVNEARLEESGQLSLLRNQPSKPAQKQDRKLLRQGR
jgi:uncharacterized membrane protein YcaP (DUF421 family)